MAVKQKCIVCGQTLTARQFVSHRNVKMNDGVGICKNCVYEVNVKDRPEVIDMFRMLNIPFDEQLFDEILNVEEKDKVLANYLRAIARRKDLIDFLDSSIFREDSIAEDEEHKNEDLDNFEITPKVIGRWGAGKDKEEYMTLEYAYKMLADTKPPSTLLEETRYVQNVKLKITYDQALDDGVAKDIKIAKEAYTKDLKELGLDTISANDELKLIGIRIKEWELHDPVPETDEELKDVNMIQDYIRKFFLIPMKRVFNFATQEEINELNSTIGEENE